jgi:hypothetical protein
VLALTPRGQLTPQGPEVALHLLPLAARTTSRTTADAKSHSTARGTHPAPSGRYLVRQVQTTRFGSLFHAFVVFLADLRSLLYSLHGAHFRAIFEPLLLRHKLAAHAAQRLPSQSPAPVST